VGVFLLRFKEGVTRDGITVLQIDEVIESVKITNAGIELTLTEKDITPKSPGANSPDCAVPSTGSPPGRVMPIQTPATPAQRTQPVPAYHCIEILV
jgi:hypothetical protein